MELDINHLDFRISMPDGKLLEVHPELNEDVMEYHTFLEGQPHAIIVFKESNWEVIAGDFNLSDQELIFITGKIEAHQKAN